jgi:ATPases of the AAA+ class
MNNQDYKALHYIDKILNTGDIYEYGLLSYNRELNILPLTKQENEKLSNDEICDKIRKQIRQFSKNYDKTQRTNDDKKIEIIAKLFGLCPIEQEILSILHMCNKNRTFREFLFKVNHISSGIEFFILPIFFKKSIVKYVHPNSFLIKTGLIAEKFGKFALSSFTSNLLRENTHALKNCIDNLLGKPLKSDLKAKDFTYIPERDFALKILNNPIKKGINILLYGAPGTGKTAFAKMLAGETRNKLYTVGEEKQTEESKNYRLHALYRNLRLLSKKENACLLFDEAEDIFSNAIFSNGMTKCNKVEINRLLEENDIPVIWTTNNISEMDKAFVRRFTLAIHFKTPPLEIRQKIWDKYLKENKIASKPSEVLSLAKTYVVPPSMISASVQATKMVNGDINVVKEHLDIMRQAMNNGVKIPLKKSTEIAFYPKLLNTDLDLEKLKNQLVNLGKLNFSLCLYGASGTGKSAYARYLADVLNIKYRQKRVSDLLSPYVGRTEQNIAMAFAEAKEEKSLLIFDEADSFLQDRIRAHYSWEKTAVNEMLTWMESHPYPFICTTNLMDNLDPASLRRFTFKVKYDFLTKKQIKIAFKYFFNLKVNDEDISSLRHLTPADFTLTKSKAEIMGFDKDTKTLVKMLLEEQNLKDIEDAATIGFCTVK